MAKDSGQRRIYEVTNNRIISLLEYGEVPWREPWVSGKPVISSPTPPSLRFILIGKEGFWGNVRSAEIILSENGLGELLPRTIQPRC